QPSFIPPVLVARDGEFYEMLDCLTSPVARSVYVYGPRGVGKSVTILRVISEVAARNPEVLTVYVQLQSTMSATWASRFPNIPLRERGIVWILKMMKGKGYERGVVVFDDVQNLYRRTDLVRAIKCLYDGSDGRIAFVLAGQQSLYSFEKLYLQGELGESVRSRCMFRPIAFKPYGKSEIAAIVRQRLELATGGAGGWDDDAVDFIASKVERHGSDMRLGIRILVNAVELAVKKRSNLTLEVAQEAWQREKEDYWMKEYLELHPHKAFLLYQVFRCMSEKGSGVVLSREVYDAYLKSCAALKVKPMTGRQLFNYLQDLAYNEFIRISVELTPQGKLTKITSDLQPDMMVSAGDKIEWEKVLS
ncbi:MAG: AAA family ATPase, partial [Thermofilum sp.]